MAARRLDTEILIVGGGPAGSAAAIGCATRGLGVIVAEREARPFDRPGESLHPGVEPLLRQLGIADRLPATVGARHAGIWVSWPGPAQFEPFGSDADGPWLGFQVRRRLFDPMLLARAAELGADVRRGCRVEDAQRAADGCWDVATSTGPIRCRFVIDASGSAGWLGRRLGIAAPDRSPKLLARYGYARGACPARDEAPALVGAPTGWTWSARVDTGLYAWVRLGLDEVAGRGPPDELRALAPCGAEKGADVTWRLSERPAGPGWFIVGDAAARLDPASARGVLKAIMSGWMAAHLVAAIRATTVSDADATAHYQDWLGQGFEADAEQLSTLYRTLGRDGFGGLAPGSPRGATDMR